MSTPANDALNDFIKLCMMVTPRSGKSDNKATELASKVQSYLTQQAELEKADPSSALEERVNE